MSVKSFISVEAHLTKLGYTVEQADDFIKSNLDQPEKIYNAARDYAVTISMLNEITKHSTSVISDYFLSAGKTPSKLDETSKLVNSDLGILENLVGFNNNIGVLSNPSLREKIQLLVEEPDYSPSYAPFFDPGYPFQPEDGIYDAEELGVGHLGSIAATNENIESLFYGTLLNTFSRLDKEELNQINEFKDDKNTDVYQMLISNALSIAPTPIAWNDDELANLVINDAARIVNSYLEADFVGILDDSILGFSAS